MEITEPHPLLLPEGHTVADDCLRGGGEMGALMRSIDWSRTQLGPVSQWPRSLKTMVVVILGSRFPMHVWWGPEKLQLYNDAYRPVLGVKHPASMGAPGQAVWPEIWDVIGPMIEDVLAGGPSSWHEDFQLFINSRGFAEETFHTFSYSAVPDDEGGTGGVLNTVQETTAQVRGERQLRMLRDLAARASDAKTAEEACTVASEILAANPADLPYTSLYLLEADGQQARLCSASGPPDVPAGPERVVLGADCSAPQPGFWFSEAIARGHVLVDAAEAGLGSNKAIILSLARPGQRQPYGLMVSGLSVHRKFDERYLGLFRLTADQVVSAISNARAYEEERRRAEALAEIDRAKTAFFSNVSHEFRTPLTLMLGQTEDALQAAAPALAGESLRSVHRNALRLLKLVNALLDFSRIEAGRARASYQRTDLAAVTADLASAFRSAVERAGLRFVVECSLAGQSGSGESEPVYVDHEMWEKIVLNLLSNALKFTFEGEIRVRLEAVGDRVELAVSDTGTGIAADELPHLFERFHRVHGARSRTHEGSGIGLALVHELVRLQGGEIAVESELGRGTTFRVRLQRGTAHLPSERVQPAASPVTTASGAAPYVAEALRWLPGAEPSGASELLPVDPRPASEGGASIAAGARILLADDNADMRDYVRRLLSERWTVEAVPDGAAALSAARRQRPDLVLTDVMMPNLDGFGLLQALRAEPALAGVPVIMLSARAGEESRIGGLVAGADDYLVKPFSARELLARVATHLQLAQLRQAAVLEREKLYALFEQAPVPIVVLRGPDHRFEVANPRYLAMVDKQDVIGKPVREVFPEAVGTPVLGMYDRVFRTGEPFVAQEFEALLDLGRGVEQTFFTFNAHPMRDAEGAVDGIMVVALNITDQVRARRALENATRDREELLRREQEARQEAEAASRSKDEFLAMLGHELRNPLAPISTALHLMRLRAGTAAAKERRIIERQVAHLSRLVDDLLDVSRITRGKIELKRDHHQLAAIVANAIEMVSPLLEQRQHHLEVSVPADGLPLEGDGTRLAQVVFNLLSNAAKYTEPGGRISVSARREADALVLEVADDGIGISAEVLPGIFELFVQERQALDRSQGGLGLGLAIVRSLVAMHGGTVTAASAGVGKGSQFVVRLPAAPAEEVPEVPGSTLEAAPERAGGHRILVVDDNVDAGEALAELLAEFGHVTQGAMDGPSALRVAEQFAPSVAFLDIGLPVMDGYELAQRMRQLPGGNQVKLIALTGYGQASDRRRSKEAGFDAHLVKPVAPEDVERVLTELTAAKRAV